METFNVNKKWELPNDVIFILDSIHKNGFEAYVIGGAVRSFLLDLPIKDYDIITNATPEQLEAIFEKSKAIGKAFGVISVALNNISYEIATYRTDGDYNNGRTPQNVEYAKTIEEDIERRDFTINAMYYDYEKDIICDLKGGFKDIQDKIIRCIGEPTDRLIKEDCLRMLRAIRFACQLDFTLDHKVFDCISKNATHIKRISVERIQEELNKILLSNFPYIGFRWLIETNLLYSIIPELAICAYMPQYNSYHYENVFEHSLHTLLSERCFKEMEIEEADIMLIIQLTLLLHDIGKVETFTFNNGNGTCKGHSKASTKLAFDILTRLKYSNPIIETVCFLIERHDMEIPLNVKSMKKILNNLRGFENYVIWTIIKYSDLYAHTNYNGSIEKRIQDLHNCESLVITIMEQEQCFQLKDLAVNGNDLIDLGYKGKEIGNLLNKLLDLVINEELDNKRDDLIDYIKINKII